MRNDRSSAQITITGNQRRFRAGRNETILAAALRQGIVLPYSCRNGTCASCKCRLLDGRVCYPFNPPQALTEDELFDAQILSCQAVAEGDVVIDAREIEQIEEIPVRLLPARVESMDRLTAQVMRLRLKLPAAARLQFLAGQYIDVLLAQGKRRAFSIASPPGQPDFIELHVKHVEGGGFTGHVFNTMQTGEILRFEGPLGTFFFRRSSPRPALLMAGGTGFAPLKSMIEELIDAGDPRPIELFWGARCSADLYAADLIEQWLRSHQRLSYVPVLTEPDADWTGDTGLVHEAVLRRHRDLSGYDVYMSGPPAMIRAARGAFLSAGLPEERLFYDSFDFAPDVPPDSR